MVTIAGRRYRLVAAATSLYPSGNYCGAAISDPEALVPTPGFEDEDEDEEGEGGRTLLEVV